MKGFGADVVTMDGQITFRAAVINEGEKVPMSCSELAAGDGDVSWE